ncbi:MAG: hypothetical protein J6P03_02285 [Opitutales bacterium]|nr:hypothetical protein [Opitutales bacterium]
MNSHILIGYAFDKTHRVILDGAPYAQIKKAYIQTKVSDKYSKLEIWSRANGLEKSKRLRNTEGIAGAVDSADGETSPGDDFKIDEPAETKPAKKRKGKAS